MTGSRPRLFGAVAIAVAIFVGLSLRLIALQWPRWREFAVYHALAASNPPAFWWPPAWRDELETSTLLEGEVKGNREGKLELTSVAGGPLYQTEVTRGRYSFRPRVLPAGSYRVRLIGRDGTASSWLPTGSLDPGSHRINFAFDPAR
jgi:hypothetical protein